MILPNKHLTLEQSLLGVGAVVLGRLNAPVTVSELWEEVAAEGVKTFDQFALALSLLFTVGAIDRQDGRIVRL